MYLYIWSKIQKVSQLPLKTACLAGWQKKKKGKQIQAVNTHHILRTYKSPQDPDATLLPNVNCLGSISHTSVPSLGIVRWVGSDLTLIWSCSLLEDDDRWVGGHGLCIETQSFNYSDAFLIALHFDYQTGKKREARYSSVQLMKNWKNIIPIGHYSLPIR